MPEINIQYDPFPIHIPFHRTKAREKAAIGAVGSGKTIALCADALAFALEQPGSRILIGRWTVPALRDTTEYEFINLLSSVPEDQAGTGVKSMYDILLENDGIRREAGHIREMWLPNGSLIYFRSLDNWQRLMSYNLAAIYIDEASEIPVQCYQDLLSRLRQQEPTAPAKARGVKWDKGTVRQQMAICCNPDGHNWIWEYFVNHRNTEEQLRDGTYRKYYRSTSFDNPTFYVDGQPNAYLKSLLTMPELWVRRYVLCEFDTFEGQIYAFDPAKHIVQSFMPPRDWERAMGFDWGLRAPAAAVWWARKPGTTKWIQYREWLSYNPFDQREKELAAAMPADAVARAIIAAETVTDPGGITYREHIKYRAADPAIKHRQASDAKSVESIMGTYGLYFQMGAKDYATRIAAMQALIVNGDYEIMDSCPITITMTEQYRWAKIKNTRETDGPERPHKKDDHAVDAGQYLATLFYANRIPEPFIDNRTDKEIWDAHLWDTINKQVQKPPTSKYWSPE